MPAIFAHTTGTTMQNASTISAKKPNLRLADGIITGVAYLPGSKLLVSSDGKGEIYLWDIAAARLIVRQAGGREEILREQANRRLSFLASNGRIHDDLKTLLNRAVQATPDVPESL